MPWNITLLNIFRGCLISDELPLPSEVEEDELVEGGELPLDPYGDYVLLDDGHYYSVRCGPPGGTCRWYDVTTSNLSPYPDEPPPARIPLARGCVESEEVEEER